MNLLLNYNAVIVISLALCHLITTETDIEYRHEDYESFVSACVSNPCLNRGMCLNKEFGRTCICSYGFTGENCETDISLITVTSTKASTTSTSTTTITISPTTSTVKSNCVQNNCKNNSTCTETSDGYKCECQRGFEGDLCELLPLAVLPVTCQESHKLTHQYYIILLLILIIVFLLLLLILASIILIRQHIQFKNRPVVNREIVYSPAETQAILPNAFDDKRPPAKITYVSATYFENDPSN